MIMRHRPYGCNKFLDCSSAADMYKLRYIIFIFSRNSYKFSYLVVLVIFHLDFIDVFVSSKTCLCFSLSIIKSHQKYIGITSSQTHTVELSLI